MAWHWDMELTCRMFQCIKKAWLSHRDHLFGNRFGIFFFTPQHFGHLVFFSLFYLFIYRFPWKSMIHYSTWISDAMCHWMHSHLLFFCEKLQLYCTNSENSMPSDLQRQDASIKENICCQTVLLECLVIMFCLRIPRV